MLKRKAKPRPSYEGSNIIVLRQRLLAHHREVLRRWVAAGRCMGLCDASTFLAAPGEADTDYVLVWVRENPDPAYMITPDGMDWEITDCVRAQRLCRQPSFEAALNFIRPVLDLNVAAA